MAFSVSITKRVRTRQLRGGRTVRQLRYVLNYRDPKSGRRRQEFFERYKDAQARQSELVAAVQTGAYCDPRQSPTIAQALDHYLDDKRGQVKPSTLQGYEVVLRCIKGPVLIGTARQRHEFTATGHRPEGTRLVTLLGDRKLSDLTTAEIRTWHRTVADQVGAYTANRAASHLRAILAFAEEDFGVRAPAMPYNLARSRSRSRKAILSPRQVGALLRAAQQDRERGIYYAFPFLAGTRPSEQLGLLWEDVDFDADLIRVRRIQERDGSITNMTKSEAGTREVPMAPLLREMLLQWRVACPRLRGELHRVFPGLGRKQPWPKPRSGGGGPLLYQNFRVRIWRPVFDKLGLPYVTPHSARHCFISTLQAQGVEVGLVAKLAGHANAVVTLGHYTQAVRGGQDAMRALEAAFVTERRQLPRADTQDM